MLEAVLLELLPVLDEATDRLAAELCPWDEFAAASEITPVAATAAAIAQRLIREIRASPASRTFALPLTTVPMVGPRRKKRLSQA